MQIMLKKIQMFLFSVNVKLMALAILTASFYAVELDAQIQAKPADKFVDMIGVDVHFARSWTAYTNSDENINAEQTAINVLTSLRIRHLRDGIWGWNGGVEDFDKDGRGVVERFSTISQAGNIAGIPGGVTWILTDNTNDWRKLRDNYLIPLGNKVIVLEGANENMGVSGDAQAYTQIRNWWNNILPVMPHLKIATNTGPTNPCEIKNSNYIGDYVHYGNAHPYHFWPPFKPWNKVSHCNFNSTPAPPTTPLWTSPDNTTAGNIGFIEATRAKRILADQPMIFTEWGYPTITNDNNNWGVDEATAAKYVLRSFLEHFNAGIVYSCTYELMNGEPGVSTDPEHNFGLADFNGNLKQSGVALKRLIALLEDNGNTEILTNPLNYTLSDGGGLGFSDDKNPTTNEVHQTLVQKIDGTYYLVLWQEAISTNSSGEGIAVPSVNITINFDHTISSLKAYLPATTDNASPVSTNVNTASFTISVPDHPVVIEINDSQGAVLPESLTVSPEAISIDIGGAQQITTTILPSTATNKNVIWESSNEAVATVNSAGIVKGISTGTAILTATTASGNSTSTTTVTVTSAFAVTGIKLDATEVTVLVGSSKQLTASVFPQNATNKNLIWSTSDASIASVNQGGVISSIAPGEITITAKTVDGDFEATCLVVSEAIVTANDEAEKNSFHTYPNPVTDGKLFISGINGSVSIKITDANGKSLWVPKVITNGIIEIEDLNLKPGLYFLSINDDTEVFKILIK